jgi:hypothetical protein
MFVLLVKKQHADEDHNAALWKDTYRGNPTCSEKIVTIQTFAALERPKPNT